MVKLDFLFFILNVLQIRIVFCWDRAVVVTRHGDRAPLKYFDGWDGATEDSKYWPYGRGQLSRLGKRRMYLQGRFLRDRYAGMFDKGYITPRDVNIQSSGIDRCLETAQVLAAVMLQPKEEWVWAEKINWQPVPIRSWPPMLDAMLVPSSVCEVADRHYANIPNDGTVKAFLQAYEGLIRRMSEQHGCDDSCRAMRDLFDNILTLKHHRRVEEAEGLPEEITSWLDNSTYQNLKTLFEFSFQVDYTGKIANPLRRLRAGLLMKEVFNMLDPQFPARKLNILSTHDSAIFHLLDALGYELKETFKFGVTLLFEATKISDNNSEIEISIINNVSDDIRKIEPKSIKLTRICPIEQPTCKLTLQKLRAAYKFVLIENYQEWLDYCSGRRPL